VIFFLKVLIKELWFPLRHPFIYRKWLKQEEDRESWYSDRMYTSDIVKGSTILVCSRCFLIVDSACRPLVYYAYQTLASAYQGLALLEYRQ
jgi:hypothetical protein